MTKLSAQRRTCTARLVISGALRHEYAIAEVAEVDGKTLVTHSAGCATGYMFKCINEGERSLNKATHLQGGYRPVRHHEVCAQTTRSLGIGCVLRGSGVACRAADQNSQRVGGSCRDILVSRQGQGHFQLFAQGVRSCPTKLPPTRR